MDGQRSVFGIAQQFEAFNKSKKPPIPFKPAGLRQRSSTMQPSRPNPSIQSIHFSSSTPQLGRPPLKARPLSMLRPTSLSHEIHEVDLTEPFNRDNIDENRDTSMNGTAHRSAREIINTRNSWIERDNQLSRNNSLRPIRNRNSILLREQSGSRESIFRLAEPSNNLVGSSSSSSASLVNGKDDERSRLVKEICETEKSYRIDLDILQSLFAIPSQVIFPANEWKTLFGLIPALIELSNDLSTFIDSYGIATAFESLIVRMNDTFGAFCKGSEMSLELIKLYSISKDEEIINFLGEATQKMKLLSHSWDLSSLLIKPIQRILKYPLLLKRLHSLTPNTSPEFIILGDVCIQIEKVAVSVDQMKRRKDVVDKYVKGKQTNISHGISKKWNRGTQVLKNKTVGEAGERYEEYEALMVRFDLLLGNTLVLNRKCFNWLDVVKEMGERDLGILASLEESFATGSSVEYESNIKDLQIHRKRRQDLNNAAQHEVSMKDIIGRMVVLEGMFDMPHRIMRKRQSKLLDFERVVGIKGKGEKVDRKDSEDASEFEAIHVQLMEELPAFFDLIELYMSICIDELVNVQATFYGSFL